MLARHALLVLGLLLVSGADARKMPADGRRRPPLATLAAPGRGAVHGSSRGNPESQRENMQAPAEEPRKTSDDYRGDESMGADLIGAMCAGGCACATI